MDLPSANPEAQRNGRSPDKHARNGQSAITILDGDKVKLTDHKPADRSSSKLQRSIEIVIDDKKQTGLCMCFTCCTKVVLVSMSLVLLTILAAFLAIKFLHNDDPCERYPHLPHQRYNLFATKTTYSTARLALSSSSPTTYHSGQLLQLPKIFAPSDSLEDLHFRLTSENCSLLQLNYYGRHAARFPGDGEAALLSKHIVSIQNRIDLSSTSLVPLPSSGPQDQAQEQQDGVTAKSVNVSSADNKTLQICQNSLTLFKRWRFFMEPEQENLILESGHEESVALANRLKRIYPAMFDGNATDIDFGVTQSIRTSQTAVAFLRAFNNFQPGQCSVNDYPVPNNSFIGRTQEISNHDCLRNFANMYHKDHLSFHKKCRSYNTEISKVATFGNLLESPGFKAISQYVSEKLNLAKSDHLSSDETKAIYDVCKYESALAGSSIWCNLFTAEHLRFLEYLSDVEDFFTSAYGNALMRRSACPLTKRLEESLKQALIRGDKAKPQANFYFTHSEALQKLIAASVDLEFDGAFNTTKVSDALLSGKIPQHRDWRTSLLTPFSSNVIYTLYQCPATPPPRDGSMLHFYANYQPFKVVASINERPILLEGCDEYICDYPKLIESTLFQERKCNLKEICSKKFVLE